MFLTDGNPHWFFADFHFDEKTLQIMNYLLYNSRPVKRTAIRPLFNVLLSFLQEKYRVFVENDDISMIIDGKSIEFDKHSTKHVCAPTNLHPTNGFFRAGCLFGLRSARPPVVWGAPVLRQHALFQREKPRLFAQIRASTAGVVVGRPHLVQVNASVQEPVFDALAKFATAVQVRAVCSAESG